MSHEYRQSIYHTPVPDNVSNDCCLTVEFDVDQFEFTPLPSHFEVSSVVNETVHVQVCDAKEKV